MYIPKNKNRPDKANTQYPITSLFQIVPDRDGDPEVKFDYFTSNDLIRFVGRTYIEMEELDEGKSKAGKTLPDFFLKCQGVNIGAGFKSMNENAKYSYKCRLGVKDSNELGRLPSGILKMVQYQKEGTTPTGQALKPGLSLFFYPHVKIEGGWHIKILTEDYKSLLYPILAENEKKLDDFKQQSTYKQDNAGADCAVFPGGIDDDESIVGPSPHREKREAEFQAANSQYQRPATAQGFNDEVPF